jgi:hypothetical protein
VDEVVVLDAVGVAALARAARDLAETTEPATAESLQLLPDPIVTAVRPHLHPALPEPARDALVHYAIELDEIAEAAVTLDQHDHEIEHQLQWWDARAETLEAALTGHPGDDIETARELALYRGRISGARTMRRHYGEQRRALLAQHLRADAVCVDILSAL